MSSSTTSSLSGASAIAPPNRSHKYKIASIPADGIGPEVVSAAIEVVKKVAETLKTFTIEFDHIPWGTAYYKEHGKYVDDDVLGILRGYDASLFGSVGAPGPFSFLWHSYVGQVLLTDTRRPRSHLSVGSSPQNQRTTSIICQRPPSPHVSRDSVPFKRW